MIIFKSRGKYKSLALFLVLVFIFELVVQFVPSTRAYAIDYSAVANNYFELGFDNYKGITRADVIRDIFNNNVSSTATVRGYGTYSLNTELAIDYRKAVYGLPTSIPGNQSKPSSVGYWYVKNGAIVTPGTAGATRVVFQYMGFDKDGGKVQDPYWVATGDDNLQWSDLTLSNLASKTDSDVAQKFAGIISTDDSSQYNSSIQTDIWNNVRTSPTVKLISSNSSLSGHTIGDLSWLNAGLLFSKGVIDGSPQEGTAAFYLFFRKNGQVYSVKFAGSVNKILPSQQQISAYSISYGSSLPKSSDGSAFVLDPTKNSTFSLNLSVKGVFTDYHSSLPQTTLGWIFNRDDARYFTVINYFKINGVDYTDQLIYKGIRGENQYREASHVDKQSDNVVFTSSTGDYNLTIPADLLQTGDNTITVSAKVRVFFTAGYHTDSYNSASQTIKITKQPTLQTPQLQLSVTPSQSTITITNGQYSPSQYVTHNISAKVTVPSPPAGYQVTAMEFYIDTSNPPAGNVITKTISNGTGTSYSFDNIKSFQYDASKIPLKTDGTGQGTPAYYGKVRYKLERIGNSNEYYWSGWGSANTKAKVDIVTKTGTPTLTASTADRISIDSSGTPKSYTVKITANANIDEIGNKTIQKWVFTAVHNENTSETGTSTVTTTSKNASTTISIPIATNKDRTTETFDVTATLYFTDGTKKESNTVEVEVPVNVKMDINLDFTGPTQIVGNEGDSVTIPLKAVATIPNKTQTIKLWRVWIRQDTESLLSPTYQTTSDVASVTATKTYPTSGTLKLTKDMNGQTLTFIARAKAQPATGDELDSGQKTLIVKIIVNTTDKPVPTVKPPAGDVTCEGLLDPMTVPATLNPFTGEITPDTTTVKTGIRASISDTGGRTVARWELYVGRDTPSDLMATYYTRNTSVEIPISSTDSRQYTVNNKDGLVKFAYKAVVYFTDGTYKEGTDEKVFAVSRSYANHPPKCFVTVPGIVAQGDDITISVSGYDEDVVYGDYVKVKILDNECPMKDVQYLYNSDNLIVMQFWTDTLGVYKIRGIAVDKIGAGNIGEANITIAPALPLPKINVSGELKSNRKILLDGLSSYSGSKRATILWDKAQWKIEPYSGLSSSDIVVIDPTTGTQQVQIIAKKEGQIKATLTITNSYGNTQSTSRIITVKPDKPPVASFTMPTKIIRDPNDSSQATIQINSTSYSPDGDAIAKHAWFYAYDSNNDGNFDDETWYIRRADGTWQAVGDWGTVQNFDIETVDTGNNTAITLKTANVGRYKVALVVREGLDLTGVGNWVSVYDLQKGNTYDWDENKVTAEVINIAPITSLGTSKVSRKKINLTILTDKTDLSDVNAIKSKLDNLKAQIYSYGVDINYSINNMETVVGKYSGYTTMTQYIYKGQNCIQGWQDTTIYKLTGNWWNSIGSVRHPVTSKIPIITRQESFSEYKDSKIYSEYLDQNKISIHNQTSNYYWDYIFNEAVVDYTINYYVNGTYYSYYYHAHDRWDLGDVLFSYPTVNPFPGYDEWLLAQYMYQSLKYIRTIQGYQFVAVNDPYLYFDHQETSNTYVTKDILGVTPSILFSSSNDDNICIFLTDSTSTNFMNTNYYPFGSITKNFLRFLMDKNTDVYMVVPSSILDTNIKNISDVSNATQDLTLRQLANATDGKLYDSAGNAIATLDQALNEIKAKYTNTQITPDPQYVLANEEKVIYYPYWEDYENDPIINQRWRYEHDETVFDNSLGKAEFDGIWLNTPIEVFPKPGKYTVTFQVQDNPPPGTSDFDEYKLWSKLERQMVLYVHRRPIADFVATYNKSTGKVTITDKSYDPDHQYNRSDKGIIAWKWQYKTLDDTSWIDTTLANLQSMTLQSGKIYLIKLEVQDCDGPGGVGVWSKPKIAMIDLSVSNNPPVADFTNDSEILKGNQPSNLTDKSYDPDNDPITTWHWWIYNSDNTVNKDFAEVGNNNIANVKSYIATLGVGNYIAKLQVKDSAGNYSAIASKNFTVYTETQQPEATNNAPTGTFTMTINDFRTKLKPTTTYTDPDSDPKNAEQWYIKFNGQTKYYNNLPNTLEEAGYIYDGQYEIGYRVLDNPTARSSKLTPLWSNWYTQVYNLSSTITINAWTEKIAKRAHRKSEVDLTTKKTSTVLIGEGIVVKAKTTGYVYKIDAWFDRVDTVVYTPNRTPVTKTIVGYWECNIKAKTIAESMVLTNIHTKLDPAKSFTQPPNSMDWSSDVYDRKLQVRFIINHDNSFVRNNDYSEGLGWGDQAKNLWEGVYCWSDWNLTQYPTFNKDKAMAMYGRVPYFKIGDKLWIKVRAYKKNADGTDTTKDVDLPITINGSLVIQAGF
ncbi:hypothetical protein ACAG39_01815 [Caldicellulosiruptoraceae bacterium PP1]